MGWFSTLFSVEKTVDNVVDKDNGLLTQVGSWIGGMDFTEEEKAENNKELVQISIQRLKALEPFKVMQRIMVTIIMSVWALYCVAMLIAIFIWSDNVIRDILLFIQTPFVWLPVSGAVGLYLMGGVVPPRNNNERKA